MAAKKTIVYVVTEDWYFWLHRLALARAALAAGYRVTVAAKFSKHENLLLNEGFELVPLPWSRRGGSFIAELQTCWILWRLFVTLDPDVVHSIALKAIVYGGTVARIAGVRRRVSTVAGLGYVFTATQLKARLIRPLILFALRFAMSGKNGWVTLENPDDADRLVENGALLRRHIAAICCCGVDTKRFSPSHNFSTDRIVAGMACRLVRDKGAAIAVDVVKQLKADSIPVDFRLAGSIDPGSSDCHTTAEVQGWADDGFVRWEGQIEDVAGFWRSCNVAIYPSNYGEGVPRSLLEAAACGLPIITTDRPGCRLAVRDGITGFLVPPNDPAALAEKLRILIDNPALRLRMGEAGRRRAVAEFSDDVVLTRMLAVYGEPEGEAPPRLFVEDSVGAA